MTAAKRVRWQCPTGDHPGELGSTRPRKDSLIRYCLPCSITAGRLVERVAPALERKRESDAERAREKAKAKRQRAATARARAKARDIERHTIEGVDIRDEFKRLFRLRAFGGKTGRLVRRPPTLEVRHRSSRPSTYLGWTSTWENKIRVFIYPGMDLADMREILVHELTHLIVRVDHSVHGPRFWEVNDRAFREAYGKDVPIGFRFNRYHGRLAEGLRERDRRANAATQEAP